MSRGRRFPAVIGWDTYGEPRATWDEADRDRQACREQMPNYDVRVRHAGGSFIVEFRKVRFT